MRLIRLLAGLAIIIFARGFQHLCTVAILLAKFLQWVSVCLALLATRVAKDKEEAEALREALYATTEKES